MKLLNLLETEKLGLTVYMPDCAQSRLWGNIDHAIAERTGLFPVLRRWFVHDYSSISQFYPIEDLKLTTPIKKYKEIPCSELISADLFVHMQVSGPSLLTFWKGDFALEKLLAVKGKTNPSESSSDTIRGSFWCDNSTCNLMHCSDDENEIIRELKVLGLSKTLAESIEEKIPLIDVRSAPEKVIPHCSISVLCDVVNRLLPSLYGVNSVDYLLPKNGFTEDTEEVCAKALKSMSELCNGSNTSSLIDSFLAGESRVGIALLKELPTTEWEAFAIRAGLLSRKKWVM